MELNRQAHYADTAPELWARLDGKLDYSVCGIGSNGTISGIGRYLKDRDPNVTVIGIEPRNSGYRPALTDGANDGDYGTVIEDVGKRPPSAFDAAVVDNVIQVDDSDALACCHRPSHGAGNTALAAADTCQLARMPCYLHAPCRKASTRL